MGLAGRLQFRIIFVIDPRHDDTCYVSMNQNGKANYRFLPSVRLLFGDRPILNSTQA